MNRRPRPLPLSLLALALLATPTGCQQAEQTRPRATVTAAPAEAPTAAPAGAHAHAGEPPCAACGGAAAAPTPASCDRPARLAETLRSGTQVLAGITLQTSVEQWQLLEQPARYEGKRVRIEGPIAAICQGAGCWAAVRGPRGKLVDLKVDDGVVDFRKIAAIGQYAVGEGTFSAATGRGRIALAGARIGPGVCR